MSPLFYGVLKKSTHTSPQGVVVTPLNLAFTRQSRLISVKFRTTKWDCLKNQKHKPLYLWDSIKTWDSISLQYLPFWNQRLWHILLIQAIRRSQKRPGTCQVLRLMPLILAQVRQRQVHFCDSGRKIICEFKKKNLELNAILIYMIDPGSKPEASLESLPSAPHFNHLTRFTMALNF